MKGKRYGVSTRADNERTGEPLCIVPSFDVQALPS